MNIPYTLSRCSDVLFSQSGGCWRCQWAIVKGSWVGDPQRQEMPLVATGYGRLFFVWAWVSARPKRGYCGFKLPGQVKAWELWVFFNLLYRPVNPRHVEAMKPGATVALQMRTWPFGMPWGARSKLLENGAGFAKWKPLCNLSSLFLFDRWRY